jgi:hypothetical protein
LISLAARSATEGETSSTLKYVKPGDAIMSLLSFLDHLASKNKPYKTVLSTEMLRSFIMSYALLCR